MECLIKDCNFNYNQKCMKNKKMYKKCDQKENITIEEICNTINPIKDNKIYPTKGDAYGC